LAYHVRLMRKEDIPQVNEIDREAFPTLWPPANYQRELNNQLAHYIVACDEEKRVEPLEPKATPQKGFPRLTAKLRQFFNHDYFFGDELPSGEQYIFGFAGFWIMAGEAHITNIAVREQYQRQGMGELMLISLIDLAIELDAHLITLEVRASNTTAQNLYSKYGFIQVGLRRGYYTDNREDGVLMTLEDITSDPVQSNLQQLKKAHAQKWRITATLLSARTSLAQPNNQ
jgi:ribosomal-protein-alanine N-acetyltransferase